MCCALQLNLFSFSVINFGTLFKWTNLATTTMLTAITKTQEAYPRMKFIWKADIKNAPCNVFAMKWLPSVARVYSHHAVKAIIHHGGGNTFNEAILYGLPQLVVPQWFDCFDYATSVENLGLGLQTTCIGPELEAEEISFKLMALLKQRHRILGNVRIWQRKAKDAGGSKLAASIIMEQADMQSSKYMELTESKGAYTLPELSFSSKWTSTFIVQSILIFFLGCIP